MTATAVRDLAFGSPAAARRRLVDIAPPVAVFVGVVAAWEAVVAVFGIQRALLPSPSAIGAAFTQYFHELYAAASYTLVEAVGGLVIGVAAGILVALSAVRWTGARQTLLPFAVAANSVPIVAFAPLANNWFGLQNPLSKMVIAAVIVFFPVMINTLRGLTLVDASALELMRSYAARERTILWKLRIPNALPFLFTALKIATTLSLIGAVVAEYFGAPRASLGQYIVQQAAYFGFARSWAAIIFACAIGIGLYLVVVALERVAMPWHSSVRSAERPA